VDMKQMFDGRGGKKEREKKNERERKDREER
jgi:hypothetical protein